MRIQKSGSKKQPKLTTLDIDPNRFYMATHNGVWHPCSVVCSLEPGWQRGYVALDFDKIRSTVGGARTTATVVFHCTHTGYRDIPVIRLPNEEFFRFLDCGAPSLIPFSLSWLESEKQKADKAMSEARARQSHLTTFTSIYNSRGAKHGWPLAAD